MPHIIENDRIIRSDNISSRILGIGPNLTDMFRLIANEELIDIMNSSITVDNRVVDDSPININHRPLR